MLTLGPEIRLTDATFICVAPEGPKAIVSAAFIDDMSIAIPMIIVLGRLSACIKRPEEMIATESNKLREGSIYLHSP